MSKFADKSPSDRGRRMLRNALLCGVSALTVGALSAPAVAQDAAGAGSGDVETVIVTGLIGSLQRDLDIKRQAAGLVDAISAEDIGKFPDTDVAAALQHVPGVTVSRASNGTQQGITVRGFGPSFNETLFDGRKASAISGRGFDFSNVGADFVSEVDVYKTPDAALSSGAIGATVNIKYPKPFDHPGFRAVGSLSTTFTDTIGNPLPNGDVLISDTFDNDHFGILVAGAFSSIRTRDNHLNTNGWEGNYLDPCQLAGATTACGAQLNGDTTKPIWYMQEYQLFQDNETESRIDGRFALQWKPTDSMVITLNDDYQRHTTSQQQYGFSTWFNQGGLRNVVTSKQGTVISFDQPGSPTDLDASLNYGITEDNEYGLNLNWQATEKLNIILDADQAEAQSNPGGQITSYGPDVGYGPSKPGGTNGADFGITVPGGHALPYPVNYGPNNNKALVLNNGLIGSHVLTEGIAAGLDKVQQYKAQATWAASDNLQITAGFQYVGHHHNSSGADDFGNNNWQAYAGYGAASNNFYPASQPGVFVPVATTVVANVPGTASQTGVVGAPGSVTVTSTGATTTTTTYSTAQPGDPGYFDANCPVGANGGNPCPAGAALPQGLFTQSISTASFISGWSQKGQLPPIPKYNGMAVLNYLQGLGNPQAGYIPGVTTTCCNPPFTGTYTNVPNVGAYEQIIENTDAGYIKVESKTHVGDMPLKVNVGVRQEFTNVTTIGIGREPTALTVQASDHTAFSTSFGPTTNVKGKHSYSYLLPNVDLTLQVNDQLQLRADFSRTLTRPPLTAITPVLSVPGGPRVGALTASGGNPDLMPYLSDNLDASLTDYYAPNSYASIDVFNKNVTNFVVGGTTQQGINGVQDPTTGALAIWSVSAQVNGPTADVYGVELGWQHVLGDSGFGWQMNGTIVGTNKPYDPNNLTTSGFAVTGLADSANLVGFYDKDGFQARVSVTWNDTVLDRFGQTQNNSKFGSEPTFVDANTHVDFSTSYDITDHASVYFTAQNLTDATLSTHGRFSDQVLDVFDYGRRFTVGLHYKL